jgi:NTE family protein
METITTHPRSGFGVALGGGGSRAFVHLGVLQRLEEEGLRPSWVSGSSMGAVLGALYAADPDLARRLPEILGYFRSSSLFGGLVRQDKGDGLHRRPGRVGRFARKLATAGVATAISFRRGLRRLHPVNHAIDDLFGAKNLRIEDLALPFGLNALNLTDGREEEFVAGDLAPALKAGVAIGLVFAPHEWNDRQYADAAPIRPVPVGLCRRLGAGAVLAVDICAPLERPQGMYSGFDVVRRIMSVQSELLNDAEIADADILLRIDVSDVFWADFSHIDSLVARGRAAAEGIVGELRARLGGASLDSA